MARARATQKKTFEGLLAALEQGEICPVYVLHGPETYLIERAVALLRSRIAGDGGDLAYEVVRGGEVSGRDIVSSARTVSMFAPLRLLVVREADALRADDMEPLLGYLEAPAEGTCLVIVAKKVDRRLKLYSRADKLGWVHEAAPLNERSLRPWIAERARARGLALSAPTVEILAEATGTDLSIVEDALERLSLFVGDRGRAGPEDVEAVVASSRVRSVFELTDALGRKDLAAALRTLANMLENREAPLRVHAALATHVRRLLGASELGPSARRNPAELASRLGVHPFVAQKLAEQVGRFGPGELRAALVRLARTERELKSVKRPDVLVMEELVLDLCRPRDRRR